MNLDQTQAGLIRMTDDEFVKLTSFVKKNTGSTSLKSGH